MQWAPKQRKGFGWVRGPVEFALFAGDYPRIDFPSASTERRITHITAAAEYVLNPAGTTAEHQGAARFVMWKGQVANTTDLAFFGATGVALPDGIEVQYATVVAINQPCIADGSVDAPLMILRPGEAGGAMMGSAQSLVAAGFNFLADFTVQGVEITANEVAPKEYRMR